MGDKRTYSIGETVGLKATIVLVSDDSNHVVDCAGARFTPSREGLETAEFGVADIPALEGLLSKLHSQRRAAERAAAEAAAKAAAEAAAGTPPPANA